MQLLHDYVLDIRTARLSRARFAVLFVLLLIAGILMVVALGAGIGLTERFLPGLAQVLKSQTDAARMGGLPILMPFALAAVAFIWAQIALVAKRARDIGWHPVLVTVIYLLSTGVSGLGLLVALVLALVPGQRA